MLTEVSEPKVAYLPNKIDIYESVQVLVNEAVELYLCITLNSINLKFIDLQFVVISSLDWHQRSWVSLTGNVSPKNKYLYSAVETIPFPWI
jgi:hypothetical protein